MTDDFVMRAFADADDAQMECEFASYQRHIQEDESQSAFIVAALKVGMSRIDKLCKTVIESGEGDTFSEYANALLLVGFHIGYQASLEERQ